MTNIKEYREQSNYADTLIEYDRFHTACNKKKALEYFANLNINNPSYINNKMCAQKLIMKAVDR